MATTFDFDDEKEQDTYTVTIDVTKGTPGKPATVKITITKKPKKGGKQEKYGEIKMTSPLYRVEKRPADQTADPYTIVCTLKGEGGVPEIICSHATPPDNNGQISVSGVAGPVKMNHTEQSKVIDGLEGALRDGGVLH
jgi:hypothetical protein